MRVLKSWWKHNFPDDLWSEVLLRLPVKSLLRFRCVSSSCRDLIDNPDFARLQLTRFHRNRREDQLLVLQGCGRKRVCVVRCSKNFRTTSKLAILRPPVRLVTPRTSPRLGFVRSKTRSSDHLESLPAYDGVDEWYVASSIDGLFLLGNHDLTPGQVLMLWNPSIRKLRKVPPLPEISNASVEFVEMCLGFDPLNNDYKLVRFLQSDRLLFVAVYSIVSNSWTKIEFRSSRWLQTGEPQTQSGHPYSIFACRRQAVCLKGVLYVVKRRHESSDRPLELVSLDLSNETLDSTYLPDDFKLPHVLTMADGGSSLTVVKVTQIVSSVWVLQSTEDLSSWTKRYTFTPRIHDDRFAPRFLHLMKNGEVLLDRWQTVGSYNCETHAEKIILNTCFYLGKVWAYNESLILLN